MVQYEKQSFSKYDYMICIIGFFLLITGMIPYLITVVYALPAADDFTFSNDVVSFGGHSLAGVFNTVKSFYMSWQGSYYGVALSGGIDPIGRMGTGGINIVLLLTAISGIFIISVVIYKFCMLNYAAKEIRVFLTIAMLWGYFNTRIAKELTFWYNSICIYTIPLLTGLFGVICLIKAIMDANDKRKSSIFCLLSMTLGFLASGGSLQVAGYVCWLYLLFLGWGILEKKHWKITLMAFGITLLGALVNVTAPGNYNRQSTSYENISIFKAAYYTFITVINEMKYIFSQTYIPWLLLLLTIIAFLFLKPVKEKLYHPIIVGGAVLISWLISTFPVCYGYASSELASRGYEILDIYMVIGLFLFINSLVNWLKLKEISLSKEVILAVGILAVINIGYLQNSVPISKMPGIQCWQQIFSGDLKRYHDEWIEVLNTIEGSEEAVVEVPVSRWAYEADMVVMRPGMSDNFEKWVNAGIAIYYGKEKVRVVVQDEIENDE